MKLRLRKFNQCVQGHTFSKQKSLDLNPGVSGQSEFSKGMIYRTVSRAEAWSLSLGSQWRKFSTGSRGCATGTGVPPWKEEGPSQERSGDWRHGCSSLGVRETSQLLSQEVASPRCLLTLLISASPSFQAPARSSMATSDYTALWGT